MARPEKTSILRSTHFPPPLSSRTRIPPLIFIFPNPDITNPSPQVNVYCTVTGLIVMILPLPAASGMVRLRSETVTLKPQLSVPLHPLSAVQLTGVVPRLKTEPDGGVHVANTPLLVAGVA